MYQYYIITRFNLRKSDWKTTKNDETVLSESWLQERFDLFDNYCFPSVKNQTDQNFKWLVFFDINTSERYRDKIEEYRLSYKNFHPFFIDGMDLFLPSIAGKIKALDSKEYIITSRLDNDDCLHKDYAKVMHSYFDKQEYLAIDIVDGYCMQIDAKVKLGRKRQLYNPFISLIEKKDNCKTVWHKGHTFWKYEKKILRVKNKRLWLGIIHEKNYENMFNGYGEVNFSLLHEFNIKESTIDELEERLENFVLRRFQNFKNHWKIWSSYYGKEFKTAIGIYKIKENFAINKYD
jgi:hypothetical protein